MRALIKTAGFGKRLLPFTHYCPKPLLKLTAKHNLISHTIDQLAQAGIQEIVVNVCHHAPLLMEHLGNGAHLGASIHYSIEPQGQPLGTARGALQALPLLGDKPFLLISADIHSDFPFHTLSTQKPEWAHLVLVDNPSYHPNGDFHLRKNTIAPKTENSVALTYANIAVINPRLLTDTADLPACEGALLRRLQQNGMNITGEKFNGTWINVGNLQDLYRARQLAELYSHTQSEA